MSFSNFYSESVNKFNTDWQVTREEAKKIKDVDAKIAHVKKFLNNNPSKANLMRVANWTRMTSLGYKNTSHDAVQKFNDYLDYLDNNKDKYSGEDTDTDLEKLDPHKFTAVYKDLVNRKNNFQHGGKRPATMIAYLNKMKQIARERNISLPADPQS